MSTDELFASLGGSLMKDLWADLEVDGDDGIGFSLEQLERELAHLDETPGSNDTIRQTIPVISPILESAFAPPGGGHTMSTANYIVSHQNLEGAATTFPTSSQIAPPTTADAWQKSLQNFSSMSGLEHAFLAADSLRKKPKPPPGFLDRAEDYNCALTTTPIVATPVVATPLIAAPMKKGALPGMLPYGITATVSGPPPGMAPLVISHLEAAAPPLGVIKLGKSPPKAISLSPGMLPPTKYPSNLTSPPPGILPLAASPSKVALPPPGMLPPATSSLEVVSQPPKKSENITSLPSTLLPPPGMRSRVSEPKNLPPGIIPTPRISFTGSSLLPPLHIPESSTIVPHEILDEEKETEKSNKSVLSEILLESSELAKSMTSTQGVKLSETPLDEESPDQRPSKKAPIQRVNAGPHISEQQISIHDKPPVSPTPPKVSPKSDRPQQHQSKDHGLPAKKSLVQPKEGRAPPRSRVEASNVQKPTNHRQGLPKQLMQVQSIRVYCQVHPATPPIPASALESKYMVGRDLAYVLHSMLKPVLLRGTSVWDYDLQLLQRRTSEPQQNRQQQQKGNIRSDKHEEKTPDEITRSRTKKTMEWMKKENILGHVPKTDVTRPRALLATPKLSSVSSNEDQAQRALLWKGRLYIDQGQVAATSLIELWRMAPPGTVPPEVQPHLLKLFKVLGIKVHKDSTYSMDTSKNNLACILKLSKGRTFVSRLLEVALLPPKAVQVLLPVVLHYACKTSPGGDNATTDTRLFGSIMRVVVNLSSKCPAMLLACLKAVSFREALSSQPRMECVHAILRLGHVQRSTEWTEAEGEFMKLLS